MLLDAIKSKETAGWIGKGCPTGGDGESGDYQTKAPSVISQLGWNPDPRTMARVLCYEPTARIIAAEMLKDCWRRMGNKRRHAFTGLLCWNGGPNTNPTGKGEAYWYAKQVASNYAAKRMEVR